LPPDVLCMLDKPLQVFSIDVSKISQNVPKVAEVAIYDNKLTKIYSTLIYHDPKTIDNYNEKITGFNAQSFINGREFSKVQWDIKNLIGDKFWLDLL